MQFFNNAIVISAKFSLSTNSENKKMFIVINCGDVTTNIIKIHASKLSVSEQL